MINSMHTQPIATAGDLRSIPHPQPFKQHCRGSLPGRTPLLIVPRAQAEHGPVRYHLRSCAISQLDHADLSAQACVCNCHRVASGTSRRHAMLLAAGLLASGCNRPAAASMEGWDGSSAALGSCALGDDGDECRKRVIMCAPLLCTSSVGG